MSQLLLQTRLYTNQVEQNRQERDSLIKEIAIKKDGIQKVIENDSEQGYGYGYGYYSYNLQVMFMEFHLLLNYSIY